MLLTIGELARRSGVPVRTVRFWSDEGVVPPSERSAAGYRRYDSDAVARLDLVRTLRDLGLGLDAVRAVLTRQAGVADVAAAHVRAIDERIRVLRTQRAVATLLARGGRDEQEMALMNDLAAMSAAERQRVIDEFVAESFAGAEDDEPGMRIAECMRMMPASLPDEPTTEQVAAWVELAELVRDPDFRARSREMVVAGVTSRGAEPDYDITVAQAESAAALESGVAPGSAAAEEVLARIGIGSSPERERMAENLDTFTDRRVERYWTLLGVVNGWEPRAPAVPAMEWLAAALRARPPERA